MDQKIKENLEKALNSGKDALDNLREIIKNITKEVLEKSKTEGEDVKTSANKLFTDIFSSLGVLGKDTAKYLKAAAKGIKEGIKESSVEDNNLVKALGDSMLDSLKNLGEAGIYVTKEAAKNIASVIEDLFKKNKDDSDIKDDDKGKKG